MRPNQQANHRCEINNLVPRMPLSQINHTIYCLVIVIFWFRSVKLMDWWSRYNSFTEFNNLLGQNHIFSAVFSVFFSAVGLLCINVIFQKRLQKINTITDSFSRSINYSCGQIKNPIITVISTSWYLRRNIHR